MSRKKKPKQRVTDYFCSVHYGICQGPLDAITRIKINDRDAWRGFLTEQGYRVFDKPDLFGGVRKEGGVEGILNIQMGSEDQKSSAVLAGKLGGTPDTVVGYRGIATALFTGKGQSAAVQDDGNNSGLGFLLNGPLGTIFGGNSSSSSGGDRASKQGFYWSSNQPYIWPAKVTVAREPKGWRHREAGIPRGGLGRSATVVVIDSVLNLEAFNEAKLATKELLRSAKAEYSRGKKIAFAVRMMEGGASIGFEDLDDSKKAQIEAFLDGQSQGGGTTQNGTDAAFSWAAAWINGLSGTYKYKRIVPIYRHNRYRVPSTTITSALDSVDGLRCLPICRVYGTSTEYRGANELVRNFDTDEAIHLPGEAKIPFAMKLAASRDRAVDANPAHMIVECMTHPEWGAGTSLAALEESSFIAASDTFINEGFGLSMIWNAQSSIEKFVSEVLNHVNATLFVDPATGKMRILPIRDDYDVATLPVFDESNCSTDRYAKRTPSEATNELSVKWTNPKTGEKETITGQDLGAVVANNGEVIPDSRNYYGVASKALARDLLSRDLSIVAAPLSTVKIRTNRAAWDLVPGGLFKYRSDDHGVVEEVMRITTIDYGKNGKSEITITATQDIFGFAKPQFELPPDTEDENVISSRPTASTGAFLTMNYFMLANFQNAETLVTEYPEGAVLLLPETDNYGATSVEVYSYETDATGTQTIESIGVRDYCSAGTLVDPLVREVYSTVAAFDDLTAGQGPRTGGLAVIGDTNDEKTQELVVLKEFSNGQWTLLRGALDTTPKDWPAGTTIRFFSLANSLVDFTDRADGEVASYWFSMQTQQGTYNPTNDPAQTYEVTERPHRPLRPANVRVEGNLFPDLFDAQNITNLTFTWSDRNRTQEDSQILDWDDPAVTVESGQTTDIVVFDPITGAEISRVSGVTSPTDLTAANYGGLGTVEVRVVSVLNGLESLQSDPIKVLVAAGYGYNYGESYGD